MGNFVVQFGFVEIPETLANKITVDFNWINHIIPEETMLASMVI